MIALVLPPERRGCWLLPAAGRWYFPLAQDRASRKHLAAHIPFNTPHALRGPRAAGCRQRPGHGITRTNSQPKQRFQEAGGVASDKLQIAEAPAGRGRSDASHLLTCLRSPTAAAVARRLTMRRALVHASAPALQLSVLPLIWVGVSNRLGGTQADAATPAASATASAKPLSRNLSCQRTAPGRVICWNLFMHSFLKVCDVKLTKSLWKCKNMEQNWVQVCEEA